MNEITLKSWDEIHQYSKHRWVFRGQRQSDWRLLSSLERCCQREALHQEGWLNAEHHLGREFRRMLHLYSAHIPANEAKLQWMALMQHHGAPTRLVDFSYSVYVASYFALEAADSTCAVWAFHGEKLLESAISLLGTTDEAKKLGMTWDSATDELYLNTLLFHAETPACVVPLNPFVLNERLRQQKGVFLAPGSLKCGFMDNLRATTEALAKEHALRILIPYALRNKALARLRDMNITRTTLFPGIDGFAQSLGVGDHLLRYTNWIED